MTWWRTLVRWLAQREIESAVHVERVNCICAIAVNKRADFLAGHTAGVEDALAFVEREVRERMGGAADLVQEEDVAAARKRSVH